MSKAMTRATGGHNLRVRVAMALIAALLVVLVALVFALQSTPTASDLDANPANPAVSAQRDRGSSITEDPYIERHAEVVQRLGGGSLR
jgi:cytochrome oxidase Cu insertion factor (SCO1/SenC/PrrC family)